MTTIITVEERTYFMKGIEVATDIAHCITRLGFVLVKSSHNLLQFVDSIEGEVKVDVVVNDVKKFSVKTPFNENFVRVTSLDDLEDAVNEYNVFLNYYAINPQMAIAYGAGFTSNGVFGNQTDFTFNNIEGVTAMIKDSILTVANLSKHSLRIDLTDDIDTIAKCIELAKTIKHGTELLIAANPKV